MPGFTTRIPHRQTKEQALEKMRLFVDRVRDQYKEMVSDVSGVWNGETLAFSVTTYGLTIQGDLTADEKDVIVAVKIPLAAALFSGRIESGMKQAIEKALQS